MEITNDIVVAFRSSPAMIAFSSATKWPDDTIKMALCEGDAETGGRGWGAYDANECNNFKRRGMFLYAGAWLINNFGDGGPSSPVSGESRLNVQSKSVGDESIEYRVPSMMSSSDEYLTFSRYGQEFARLRKRAGMGARAV